MKSVKSKFGPSVRNVKYYPHQQVFKEDLAGTVEQTSGRFDEIDVGAEKINETDRRKISEFAELKEKVQQIFQEANQLLRQA